MNVNRPEDQVAMFKELGLERDPSNYTDTKELLCILTQYLHYPSDRLAQFHRDSNQLGVYDQSNQRMKMKNLFKSQNSSLQICQCCFCIKQDKIHYQSQIEEIETLNEAYLLFFSDIKYTAVWCLLTFCLYGIFALVTNIISFTSDSNLPRQAFDSCIQTRCALLMMSLGPKLTYTTEQAQRMYNYERWGRLVLSIVWIVFFVFKAKSQKTKEMQHDVKNITAENFSVLIRNLPLHYDQETLQRELDQYANNVSHQMKGRFSQGDRYDMKFTIVGFNETQSFYQMCQVMNKQSVEEDDNFLSQRYEFLKEWIYFRQSNLHFPIDEDQRETVYTQIDNKRQEINSEVRKMEQEAKQALERSDIKNETRMVYVTLHHSLACLNLVDLNSFQWFGRVFSCFQCAPYSLNIPGIVIEPAPQPEDVIWENIGTPAALKYFRRFLTTLATVGILSFSFVGLYILSLFQVTSDQWYISLLISVFVTLVNLVLINVIYLLVGHQKHETSTYFQISCAQKTIIAQIINTVVLNLLVNILTKKNFEKGGLAEDVFYMAISSAVLGPLSRFINGADAYRWFLRFWYSYSCRKIDFRSQRQYNLIWEKGCFEIGYQYVFVVKTCIFTAFFLSLQPIISLISCLGLILMYFSEKYYLYYRTGRPRPRSTHVNSKMSTLIRLSTVSFALGNLYFAQIMTPSYIQPKSSVIDIIILGLGSILYLIPLTMILRQSQQLPEHVGMLYQNQKIFLPSEYDRLNPLTRQQAIKRHGKFIEYISHKHCEGNSMFTEIIKKVVDETKINPVEAVCAITNSINAHRQSQKYQPYPSASPIKSFVNQDMIDQQMWTPFSITPKISLEQDPWIEVPASQDIRMVSCEDSSMLDVSINNEVIKPYQMQKTQIKGGFSIYQLIGSILQVQSEQEPPVKMTKRFSSPLHMKQSVKALVTKKSLGPRSFVSKKSPELDKRRRNSEKIEYIHYS